MGKGIGIPVKKKKKKEIMRDGENEFNVSFDDNFTVKQKLWYKIEEI